MITIIDYGLGNIKAFENIYRNLGINVMFARNPKHLEAAKKIILPGVGSFDRAMEQLNKSGMGELLESLVIETKVPVLGVCVGMQIMANSSEEGVERGLGWIDADVKKLFQKDNEINLPIPHMGWNAVVKNEKSILLKDVEDPLFYFLHSYYVQPKGELSVIATVNYTQEFSCLIESENIFAVQFHPEKSHSNGVRLLKNFYDYS